MRPKPTRLPTHHGYGEIGLSRYIVLYFAQFAWLMLGLYLYSTAFWPSTCTPENLLEVYTCSLRLPESRGFREAALLTWLWATPILVLLEISRRVGKSKD